MMSTVSPVRFARRGWAAALAVGLSLGLSFIGASPASAYVGSNFLRNWATGLCLDSNSKGEVYTLPCQQGNDFQTWEPIYVLHTSNDVVQVKNKATGWCLYRNPLDGSLETYPCDDVSVGVSWNQRFDAIGSSWTKIQLKNWFGGNCVDSNASGSAYLLDCNDGGYQQWRLGY
ncbi:ricin-type beta-trefoil lectin domain protein [Streptomyces sp. NPDC002588]|uniref:RICIN domain-containing protein n=1 Tax=Streptomyces sp. NPDC002588 TaxID=3154419 RepID=UPI0033299324